MGPDAWDAPGLQGYQRLNPHFACPMIEPTVTDSGSELVDKKRDLISKAFQGLMTKCRGLSDWPCVSSTDPLDEASWTAVVTQLQSTLLPSLKTQITHLEQIMEPADRFKDNGTTLDQISHLQSELDHTLHQIVSLVAVVRRRTLSSPANTDDQHLKELKGFRAQGLQSRVEDLLSTLCDVFSDCSQLIQLSKLSPQQHMCHDRATERKAEVARWVTQVVVMIDMDVKWLTAHEIHQIQEDWEGYVPGINSVLCDVTRLINPTDDLDDDDNFRSENPSELVIEFLQSTIPVIKLSRLFYEKLLRSGMKETPLHPFSEMSSRQIIKLTDSARSVMQNLYEISEAFIYNQDVGESVYNVIKLIKKILSEFEINMCLVVRYVLPLMPNQVAHPSSQNPLKTWLVNWKELFHIAIDDCMMAAHNF
ncbi:hypothetical protein MJO28_006899 [Puccinia striiformis f. sp. tritici]|uniref:Uncharacterized protein n=3 Tax=Puccinia striiformis TaxID=27350 RepID=A0A0L0VHM3_9BASI|nr:hypothetical protein Pst134EA_013024 [Puccinia striiformis f. sp. tritici]KAI9622006.1 hypothetical protein H4Q26_015444 [Puccinia striiformis f. sp. tritici PST-130]KNE98464.1 hypothetical protein PSTG_08203 [Puccinia striiformis f. sp. tritici PST-78]POW13790.1 hypothetical protein PSTT_03424 [Puccinia striiformis]KAH9453912.1 hypothetical protein Pst134EB_014013 [Puccinia striiformis f. sp. tritici]KAH9465129.1 hypothetical protein Pst134EA_013024 [Puccinia striiformis f. sp. tritici]